MNNNIKYTFRNGLLAVTALAAMYSCSDTWEEHYDANASGVTFNGTTMQAIQEKAPNFAKVLKAAGYDRELNSDNVYTVWAPEIDEATAAAYIEQINNGKKDLVIKKFIKSHIARYNHSINNTADTLSLANTKVVAIGTAANPTFGKANITASNISCNNGVLHIIDRENPYLNSIYEVIEETQMDSRLVHTLYRHLESCDSDKLDEDKSVYRDVDENGNRIYVDSVTERWNRALSNVDALIYEEDSNYTAIIPTAEAFQKRYEIAASLLNYNKAIVDKAVVDPTKSIADSLRNYHANMFAMKDLFFNNNSQISPADSLTSTEYIGYGSRWDESVFYKPFSSTGIFGEGKYINKYECSNGTAYEVAEYPMSVTEQFFNKIHIKPSVASLYSPEDVTFATRQHNKLTTGNRTRTIYNNKMRVKFDEDGELLKDDDGHVVIDTLSTGVDAHSYQFLFCDPAKETSAVNYTFYIPRTLSGTYEIQVVLMPTWLTNEGANFINTAVKFQATLYEKASDGKKAGDYEKGVTLIPDEAHLSGSNNALSKNISDDGTILYSDTISFGDYKFENCYYDQNEAGVILQLKPGGTSTEISRNKVLTKQMNILAIILKPKFDENTVEALEP